MAGVARAGAVLALLVPALLMAVNISGAISGGLHRQRLPVWPVSADARLTSAPLDRERGEGDAAYLDRLAVSIHRRMAVYWDLHHEAVPLQENWILNLMQYPLPAYRDYQFYDAGRALRRGIGQCGQFALIGFDVLKRQNIPRALVLLPGHTMLTATLGGREVIVDPEFGVVIPHSLKAVLADPALVGPAYGALDPADTPLKYEPRTALVNFDFAGPQQRAGQHPKRFSRRQVARFMVEVFSHKPVAVFHTNPTDSRMVGFEPISYVLKWLVPGLALALWLAGWWLRRSRHRSLA